jgi:predicted transcriptional regulator
MDKRFKDARKYNIKKLWELHANIAQQVSLGKTNIEIADELQITPQTVSNVRNSPIGKQKVELLTAEMDAETVDIGRRIREFAPKALEYLERIIEGREPGASVALRAKYAAQHLGRAGYGEITKVHSLNATVTREDIEAIKSRALEARTLPHEMRILVG